MHALMLYLET